MEEYPSTSGPLLNLEQHLRQLLEEIRQASITIYDYDDTAAGGTEEEEATAAERDGNANVHARLSDVSVSLAQLQRSALQVPQKIPQEVITRVQDGGNPAYYARQFVESVIRANQNVNGKMKAMAMFRDELAADIKTAFPTIAPEVDRVLQT